MHQGQPTNAEVLELETVVAQVDRVVADPRVQDPARAFLLLKVCQLAQVIRPDVFERYWPRLQELRKSLPSEHRPALEGLSAGTEAGVAEAAKLGGFARSVAETVSEAVEAAASDPDRARGSFQSCCERIQKKRWPGGKGEAWTVLVPAWADVDHRAAFEWLGKVPAGVQQNILTRVNDRSPMTADEWDLADARCGRDGGLTSAVGEFLDREEPILHLSDGLAARVAASLRAEIHKAGKTDDANRELGPSREKALQRYLRLVGWAHGKDPQVAESLMAALLLDTANTARFKEDWVDRFTSLRQVLNAWSQVSPDHGRTAAFLARDMPAHLRTFCLAQWYATLPTSPEEAVKARQDWESACGADPLGEAWFLITLVRRDLGETAMQLAQSSPRAAELRPRLLRALLFLDPETASSLVSEEEIAGDFIARFLRLASPEKRMELLRERCDRGSSALPASLWGKIHLFDLVGQVTGHSQSAASAYEKIAFLGYRKDESPDRQFEVYLRMHGYGQYSREQVDPQLLATLVAWDEAHPDEVGSVFEKTWPTLVPDLQELQHDLLRNEIFERSYTLMSAHPESLKKLFVSWVKREMIDSAIQWREGDTTYSFRLNAVAPFLYCLLGAQEVGSLSARRCDEILTYAVQLYAANAGLMNSAARLYASDKGLEGIHPPAPLKDQSLLSAWQSGVVEVSLNRLLTAMLLETQAAEPAAETRAAAPAAETPAAAPVAGAATPAAWRAPDPADEESYLGACSQAAFAEVPEDRKYDSDPSFQPVLDALNSARYDEAVQAAEGLIPQFPDLHLPYLWMASAYRRSGRLEESKAVLVRGLAAARQKVSLLNGMGETEWEMGDIHAAVYAWCQALHCLSANPIDYCPYLMLSYVAKGCGLNDAEERLLAKVDSMRAGQIRLEPVIADRLTSLARNGRTAAMSLAVQGITSRCCGDGA